MGHEALIDGKPLAGMWYDRGLEYEVKRQAERRAARRGTDVAEEKIDRGAFMTPYELKLAPLPCWEHHSSAAIRKKTAQMMAEIEAEAAARREKSGAEVRGMDRIRDQNPLTRSPRSKGSPKPLCHAASKEMRERVVKAYRGFVNMFREASLKVKLGNVAAARFPKCSFPPSLPFTRIGEEFDPLADAGGSRAFAVLAAAAAI